MGTEAPLGDQVLLKEAANGGREVSVVSASDVVICAAPLLAQRLTRDFPRSLDGAPAILPVGEMALRRQLEQWFETQRVRPRVVAEVEDTALLTDLGAQGF